MLSPWTTAARPKKVTTALGNFGRADRRQTRGYVGPVRQGTKKKPTKRKLTDMPEYKKRVQENQRRIQDAVGPSQFVQLFGPNSTLPTIPPEAKPKGKYSALFPGEEDVPKETEMMIGGTCGTLQGPFFDFLALVLTFGPFHPQNWTETLNACGTRQPSCCKTQITSFMTHSLSTEFRNWNLSTSIHFCSFS